MLLLDWIGVFVCVAVVPGTDFCVCVNTAQEFDGSDSVKGAEYCDEHRRSRPMGPMVRVLSNFGDRGDEVYMIPSNFCSWLSFLLSSMGSLEHFPKLTFTGRGKRCRKGN